MKVRTWRKREKRTLLWVAQQTGQKAPLNVSRHERGIRAPSLQMIARYQELTKDAVVYEDWLDLERSVEAKRRSAA